MSPGRAVSNVEKYTDYTDLMSKNYFSEIIFWKKIRSRKSNASLLIPLFARTMHVIYPETMPHIILHILKTKATSRRRVERTMRGHLHAVRLSNSSFFIPRSQCVSFHVQDAQNYRSRYIQKKKKV